MQDFPVLSMTNKQDSATLRAAISNLPAHVKYFVEVQGRGDDSNNNSGVQQQQSPLGPSPSTAVAMIILYSITGIITALFLVIIITGAIRAHRHPERYGPRDVLGRPRQSRARGLGRAILETIPIVKFGEKEPAKPTDVELGSTAEARDADGTNADTRAQTTQATAETGATEATATTTAAVTETPETTTKAMAEEHQEGIAPAQVLAVGAASGTSNGNPQDESLGCSICTEDFEKGQDLRVLPCDHKFHPECVDPWLLNVSGTCPLCRVDLRPVTSHDSTASEPNPDDLAPPLDPLAETSHRRRTAFRDIISLRHHPNASAEERISALRRFREQRRNQSGDVVDASADASTEDVAANSRDRRSKRMSVRLSDVFSGRTRRDRRDESPVQGESSTNGAQQPSPPGDQSQTSDANDADNNLRAWLQLPRPRKARMLVPALHAGGVVYESCRHSSHIFGCFPEAQLLPPRPSPDMDTQQQDVPGAQERPAKRTKIRLACQECRDRKIRCDGGKPCNSCMRKKLRPEQCIYSEPSAEIAPSYVKSLESRIRELEQVRGRSESVPQVSMQQDSPDFSGNSAAMQPQKTPETLVPLGMPAPQTTNQYEEMQSPETQTLSSNTFASPPPSNGLHAFGFSQQHPESFERGGLRSLPAPPGSTPKFRAQHHDSGSSGFGNQLRSGHPDHISHSDIAPEDQVASAMGAEGTPPSAKTAGSIFLGPSSAAAFMNLIRKNSQKRKQSDVDGGTPSSTTSRPSRARSSKDRELVRALMEHLVLPPRRVADEYIKSYWTHVHPFYPILHQPTFMEKYNKVWNNHDFEAPDSSETVDSLRFFFSIFNAVLALGCQHSKRTNATLYGNGSANTFFERAQQLITHESPDYASLQLVQSLVLAAQYLQGSDKINRFKQREKNADVRGGVVFSWTESSA
ncbi:hypothetical protein N0V83_000520 [Neocucurbitaria cava]|uniref:Zn(2)-C6 fungal-type domain-containing protein n=1 Tax=Neocucurbitaria cava TaxID=798079 RepID=A0A9W9CR93_9PLEO|nr:hypothetical protein N0V83_000520 [Neocucurbitaria cava]